MAAPRPQVFLRQSAVPPPYLHGTAPWSGGAVGPADATTGRVVDRHRSRAGRGGGYPPESTLGPHGEPPYAPTRGPPPSTPMQQHTTGPRCGRLRIPQAPDLWDRV